MGKLLLAGFFLLFVAGTCQNENDELGVHHIYYKECREFGSYSYVCFDSVFTDSRCPVDVVCVWAGEAVAGFKVDMPDERFYVALKIGEDTIIGDYKITFEDLLPYPNTKVHFDRKDYIAKILIEK